MGDGTAGGLGKHCQRSRQGGVGVQADDAGAPRRQRPTADQQFSFNLAPLA